MKCELFDELFVDLQETCPVLSFMVLLLTLPVFFGKKIVENVAPVESTIPSNLDKSFMGSPLS